MNKYIAIVLLAIPLTVNAADLNVGWWEMTANAADKCVVEMKVYDSITEPNCDRFFKMLEEFPAQQKALIARLESDGNDREAQRATGNVDSIKRGMEAAETWMKYQ